MPALFLAGARRGLKRKIQCRGKAVPIEKSIRQRSRLASRDGREGLPKSTTITKQVGGSFDAYTALSSISIIL